MNAPTLQRGWRWQFGLSTLLCVMTACAGLAWFWRPQPPETTEDSGLRVQAKRLKVERQATGGKGFFHSEPAQVWQQEVVTGPLRLKDAFGRVLLYGQCDAGVPTGTWRIYHEDGRVAQRAELADGKFAGKLVAYDERGAKVAEVSLRGQAALEMTWPHDPLGIEAPLSAMREGKVRAWWPNGRLRHAGQFANDLASGDWKFYRESGELEAAGAFHRGLRAGTWQVRSESKMEEVLFASGVRIDDPESRLETALSQVSSRSTNEQLAAVRELGRLGERGLPKLKALLQGDDDLLAVAALDALGEYGSKDAPLVEIRKLSKTAASTPVRIAALRAMVELDADSEATALRDLLLDAQTHRGQARLAALRALRGTALRHLTACEKLLADDDLAVRYAAVWLLADCVQQLRGQGVAGEIEHAVVTLKEIARRAAKSDDPWVRKAATDILIWVDQPPPRAFPGVTSVIPQVG